MKLLGKIHNVQILSFIFHFAIRNSKRRLKIECHILLVKEVFEIIKKLNRELGITILLVEQNAKLALSLSIRSYIMENGKIVMEGPSNDLLNNEDVKEFYLGGGNEKRKSFKDLKSYKRRKRWL